MLNNPNAVFLKGWEFDYQTRFWYLPGLLKGLVFNANYTRTSSKVKYPLTYIKSEFDWSVPGVVKSNIDTIYVDRLLDQPNKIINLSLGYDYKGFSGRISMNYISNVFSTTNFWPGLREDTDAYRRYDLSMKQKLPVKGLELYLNISNLTEAVDITRLRGFNPYDPDFDNSIYDEILDPSLFNNDQDADIAELLSRVPRDQRAKSQEQHYGKTIDLGFRFSF